MARNRPRTDLGLIAQILAEADRTTQTKAADKYGIPSTTVRRWLLRRMREHDGWPTAADIEAWRADDTAQAELRTRRAAQVMSYRNQVYLRRGQRLWVPADGTRRRLRALGWTAGDLATRLHMSPSRVCILAGTRATRVHHRTAAAVRRLYDQLSMTVPTHHPDWLLTRQRRLCAAKGWLPPLAWNDDEIDNPDARPSARAA
jgi:hypothetical protein